MTPRSLKKLAESGLKSIFATDNDLLGRFLSEDVVNLSTGEVYAEAGDELSEEMLVKFADSDIKERGILFIDNVNFGPHLRNTLAAERTACREDALVDIYRVMRPGEPPTLEASNFLFQNMFFSEDRYDLSEVGRVKLNTYLSLDKNKKTSK